MHTVKEVAKILSINVSTVRKLIHTKQLGAHKVFTKKQYVFRIPVESLQEFLANTKVVGVEKD